MAKVSYIDVVVGLENAFWGNLKPQDRFSFSHITRKINLLSLKKKKGLTQKSLLPQVADLWNSLSDAVKLDWKNAGAESDLNGWRLCVQDTCARIVNGLSGLATPSLLHQSWIGQLHIESPASELKIVQLHPEVYWVLHKVAGKKGMYEPVIVTELFSLPLKISLNYSSDLVSAGGSPSAKFYAVVWSLYQGRDILTTLEIPLDLVASWKNAEATLSSVVGDPIRCDLYIHLVDLQGDLYVDNIKSEHSAQNWVRDTKCNDINQGFTKAFYQIPKHWAAVVAPVGSWYESIYKDF